jgi:hypothetical protein
MVGLRPRSKLVRRAELRGRSASSAPVGTVPAATQQERVSAQPWPGTLPPLVPQGGPRWGLGRSLGGGACRSGICRTTNLGGGLRDLRIQVPAPDQTVLVRSLAPAGPRFDGDPSSPWLSHAPIASRVSLTRAKVRRMEVADNWRTGHGRHAPRVQCATD